jgi:hypothetical protein
MKKIILLLIVITIIACGCKKYNYNHTLKKIYGNYTVTSYTVDGIDSLSLFKDSLSTNFKFYFNDYDNAFGLEIDGNTALGKHILIVQKWGLMGDNTTLYLFASAYNVIGTGPFGEDKESTWTIIELTKELLRMKTLYNGKEYEISMVKY